jgi:hypothetical protein
VWGCPRCVRVSSVCEGVLGVWGRHRCTGASSSHGGVLVAWGCPGCMGVSSAHGGVLVAWGCPRCVGVFSLHRGVLIAWGVSLLHGGVLVTRGCPRRMGVFLSSLCTVSGGDVASFGVTLLLWLPFVRWWHLGKGGGGGCTHLGSVTCHIVVVALCRSGRRSFTW